jgi:hypothetical protein
MLLEPRASLDRVEESLIDLDSKDPVPQGECTFLTTPPQSTPLRVYGILPTKDELLLLTDWVLESFMVGKEEQIVGHLGPDVHWIARECQKRRNVGMTGPLTFPTLPIGRTIALAVRNVGLGPRRFRATLWGIRIAPTETP